VLSTVLSALFVVIMAPHANSPGTSQSSEVEQPTLSTVTLAVLLTTTEKFSDAVVTSFTNSYPDLDAVEDLFYEAQQGSGRADVKTALESIVDQAFTKRHVFPILQLYDYWSAHQAQPDFTWATLTPAVYLQWKRTGNHILATQPVVKPTLTSEVLLVTDMVDNLTMRNTQPAKTDFVGNDTKVTMNMTTVPPTIMVPEHQRRANLSPLANHVDVDLMQVLDFSEDVLAEDAKHMLKRAQPGSVFTLRPHPLWRLPFHTSSCNHLNASTFLKADIALVLDDPLKVIQFYKHLTQLAKTAEIDWCPLHKFQVDHSLWPANRCKQIVLEMNDLLAVKLTTSGVIAHEIPALSLLYDSILVNLDSQLKAYVFLHQLLKCATHRLQESIPMAPQYNPHLQLIMDFVSALLKYNDTMESLNNSFPMLTQSRFFLQQLCEKGVVVDLYMDWLNQFTPDHEFPPELQLRDLILHLSDMHPSTTLVRHVHKAQTCLSPMSGNNGNNQRHGNNHGANNRQMQSITNGYNNSSGHQFYSGGSV
jgi:hypothetical protein